MRNINGIKFFIFTIAFSLLLGFTATNHSVLAEKKFVIASKVFVESYVLGEIAKEKLERNDIKTEFKKGMGGTLLLWEALKNGSLQAYPEYTGTLKQVILKDENLSDAELAKKLKQIGIGITGSLGFDNGYALAMRAEHAKKLKIKKISDLRKHNGLKAGFTHEFLGREDGWKPMQRRYQLENIKEVKGLEHNLAYEGMKSKSLDLMDAFTTDPKIKTFNLKTLEDNLKFSPEYKGVYIYRLDASPKAIQALNSLAGTINQEKMIELNAIAEDSKDYKKAASSYFGDKNVSSGNSLLMNELKWLSEHLWMVFISMMLAILVGIPIGIFCSKQSFASEFIIGLIGVIQTIPSLALLAMLVPLMGISTKTAILALFLYSLLPIVRNTSSGLKNIPQSLRDSAEVIGLSKLSRLTKIYLPLASITIMAGIKTSCIINIGTTTLAALIGAGGLGEPIVSGLYLNDSSLIFQGAIPAALLALVAQKLFNLLELFVIPKGLRATIKMQS